MDEAIMTALAGPLEWNHHPEPPGSMDGGDTWTATNGKYEIQGPHGWGEGFTAYPIPNLTWQTANGGELSKNCRTLKEAQEAADRHHLTGKWQ